MSNDRYEQIKKNIDDALAASEKASKAALDALKIRDQLHTSSGRKLFEDAADRATQVSENWRQAAENLAKVLDQI